MRLAGAISALVLVASTHAVAHEGDIPAREVPEQAAVQPAEPMAERGQTLPMEPARSVAIDVREGTWLSPDISPDGRRIVFELLGDLYLLDSAGGKARPILTGMAFESQPIFSPDGKHIAYVSDRSGAENIWIADANGSSPRQLTLYDGNTVFTSPAWSSDGKAIFASRFHSDRVAFEMWRFDARTGKGELVAPIKTAPNQPREAWQSTVGAFPSPDGKFLYFARNVGGDHGDNVPEWTIVRRDLATDEEETLVSAPRSPRPDLVLGTAFRPAISPNGRLLVYGARDRGKTGLRLLDLETGEARWLAYPVQHDQLQAAPWRDLLPRHVFTPDGKALLANLDGKLVRIDIASGRRTIIPFEVRTRIGIGPSTRQSIGAETGPVQARLIQNPVPSPDGRELAFSALGSIYVMPLTEGTDPRRLGAGFQPGWSPDGHTLAFVRWTARDAGHVWVADPAGGAERRLTTVPAFYTSPVFTPDGKTVLTLRSSNDVRMHSYMEYGATREAELVAIPAGGGSARILAKGSIGGTPHFGPDGSVVFLNFADGVYSVPLAGGEPAKIVGVTGPGWYFAEGRAQADDIRISPDGQEALVQIAQQLYLIELPKKGASIDLADPELRRRKLTDVGADFLAWSGNGDTIGWAVGSTWYQRPRAGIALGLGKTGDAPDVAGESYAAKVEMPRTIVAPGSIVLRGATILTMKGDERIADADILVTDGRIAAVGQRGSVSIPAGATIRDVGGKWIVPGFIETHDHVADVRRQVLDFESWGPLANLAYGVTTAFDPSTLTIDMLAYQDAVEAGLMVGSRIPSTGTAIFSFNEFGSYDQVKAVLRRYRDHYRLGNIKMYRSGNRRVRQWIAQATREVGLQPTTEGALAMKLDLTQIIDGYAGNEHALPAEPLRDDVLTLMAQSGVGYTTTLQIGNGGPQGQDYFIVRDAPADDPKLNRFAPRFVVDMKMRNRTYRPLEDYFFPLVADSAAKLVRRGGLVGIGSHGEVPGLGFHWEMEAHVIGGMTPAEVLHAATIGSARVIGRDADFGSLEPGKVADLVILDRNPLADIRNTLAIDAVMQAGRLRDGETMDELWPDRKPLARHWYCDDRPPGTPDPCASPIAEKEQP
ncbi:MAG: amidohydrolase family protein [Novosphingobium sp.]|nr:PD40 domain-containing protein [Novosphingobium sp.]